MPAKMAGPITYTCNC